MSRGTGFRRVPSAAVAGREIPADDCARQAVISALLASSVPDSKPEPVDRVRRTIVNRPEDRAGMWQQIEGIFDNPTYWKFAASIPGQSVEGKRRKLPTIFYVAMPAFAAIWRSFSATESALREERTWDGVCEIICAFQRKYRPGDEPFDLDLLKATKPMTAQNFFDARKTWIKGHWENLRPMYRAAAIDAALELGYCDPDRDGSVNNLVREKMLVGDGKVTSQPGAIYRPLTENEQSELKLNDRMSHVYDKRAKKVIPLKDMAGSASIYKDGAGRVTIGHKVVRIAVRDNVHSNSSIILDIASDKERDEAKLAVGMLLGLKAELPGAIGVIYDTALHGTHIQSLATGGLITVCPISAKENTGRGSHSTKRVEKQGPAGNRAHALPDGTVCVHEFLHHGGQILESTLDSAGQPQLVNLGDPTIEIRRGKKHHRVYARYDITCRRHQAADNTVYTFQARWNITEERADAKAFNVAENVRVVPPRGETYGRVYGWLQTIENENNQSDRRKFLGRGRSMDPLNHLINEIGISMVTTGIAVQQARQRADDAATQAPPWLAAA